MIVRLGYSTFKIRLYWFIPVVFVLVCEFLVAKHYPFETAIVGTREVSGLYRLYGSSKNYTARIGGREVYFDPSPFGAGVSAEAGKIPDNTDISAQVVDLKTSAGTLPFLIHAEAKGTVFFEIPPHALRGQWYAAFVFYSAVPAMTVFGLCLIPGLTRIPQRPPKKDDRF